MEKLTACRICLVEDVSMYEVANKDLQDMYEKLTDIPLVTEDCRPMLACFFCYTKLKQCYQFQRKCLKAEEVFAQMLNGGYELQKIPLEFQGKIEFYGGYIRRPIEHLRLLDEVCQIEIDAITELPAVCEIKDDIEIKKEYLNVEPEVVYLENCYLDQETIAAHHSESDSDGHIPLMKIKIEVKEEQEVPEQNTRAPAAKKSKLDKQNAKPEDTVTDKQKKNRLSDSKIDHTTRNRTSKSVTKFREPVLFDTLAKLEENNSIFIKDKEIIEESQNKEIVKEEINTNYRNNSNEDNFGCKILNDKDIDSDSKYAYKKICKPNKCDICQRSFSRKDNLKNHIRTHTGVKPYKCNICQLSFFQKHHLKSHILKHSGIKPYKCDICQSSFTFKYDLARHALIHVVEKPYKCDVCQRSFSQKIYLTRHAPIHTGLKPYQCDICQVSYTHKYTLKEHILKHTAENLYKCDVCRRSFTLKSNLNKHIRIHTAENSFKCDVCQRSFTLKSNLNKHIRIHTGENPYQCDVCQRSFTSTSNLNQHIRSHTGEKPYKCDICLRSFTQKNNLKSHVLRHTGEKPYKCKICQRSFPLKYDLARHALIHTGVKPYKCDICHRSFDYKGSLNSHIKIHTGEKPYKCDICQRGFTNVHNLKRHVRVIHTGKII